MRPFDCTAIIQPTLKTLISLGFAIIIIAEGNVLGLTDYLFELIKTY